MHRLPYAQGLHYLLIYYQRQGLACHRHDPRRVAEVDALAAATHDA